jgi:hypothetical protein
VPRIDGRAPLEVDLTSTGSVDPTVIVSTVWDFGDGSPPRPR